MRPPGSYRIAQRTRLGDAAAATESYIDRLARSQDRVHRIVDSLREQISEGGTANLRIRRIFENPREIFRVEINVPEMNYQRTTLLDRDALEELLETAEVRDAFLKEAP